MNLSKALLSAVFLFPATAVIANPLDREAPEVPLADFGFVIGRIDYCGTGGETIFNKFAQGLEHFGLGRAEIQALLNKTQETREQAKREAEQKFSGGSCPEDVSQRIQQASAQIEEAWSALVQNAEKIDLRPSVAKALGESKSTKTAAAPISIPRGKYNCYTFDNGQLNYSYTDVQILDESRYSVGNKSGTYTLSPDGAMRFSGTMSNATGIFSVKSTGKAQIDLVFNADTRASMACSKS